MELCNESNKNQKVKEIFEKEQGETEFEIREDDRSITVSTPEFSYTYNKLTGIFAEMVYGNQSLLERPMEYNIWRAPTDNDRRVREEWQRAQFDRIVVRAYETHTRAKADKVEIESTLSISAIYYQRILNIRACWTIWPDGTVDVSLHAEKDMTFPMLPRFGLRMFLPKSMAAVRYCGIGPVESYVDKRRAGYHGLFETDVRAMHEDYIKPQENGSHYDCDYVTVENGRAALTIAGTTTFSFNASVYTQEELTKKMHNYELEESPYTVLCVDYRQSGIGSASCGPELREEYRLNGESIDFQVRMKPECR